ncbi:hypothetical protein [Alsobacter metallidurans]|uniref:hypothetical protein n=1 Tax=Alsobacter metallidurans TaxID=340221 RepID=UPI001FCF068A|nr:hypothetical protein [Alsobacter metallidurans]
MRECGSCTLCCKVLRVEELNKPAGTWCPSCRKGVGCGIYETRPGECRTFGCLWLADEQFPAELKPERSKVVFAVEFGGGRVGAYVDADQPAAWRRPDIFALLKRMAAAQAARRGQVIVFIRDRAIAILPDREVDLGAVNVPGKSIVYRDDPRTGRIDVQVV